ncbi:cobalamin-binding protein [Jeotgalibacillus sp. S-D1]|uniref:cobalamin B12-binding domain-containing protein n=1 Tax=Jeotgalibacillus sp. S-D1 TaxID=2552189 RepID=UPI001059CA36|nr:cobalamin-dependent protein [Jeotgalibacillus sp. S-D1]TDL30737.1 cobalamin-binding protein [Jeotgalibacillus sp. S-D1]
MMNDTIRSFTDAILTGDQEAGWNVIQRAVNQGHGTDHIFHHIITPSMVEVGRLWQENEITVADEHLATSTCDFTLARYKHEIILPRIDGKDKTKGKSLFFCVEHEEHDLGIRMTAQLFEEAGYEVRMMGANLPLEYASKMAAAWQPDVVGVSASMLEQGKKMPSYIEGLMQTLDTTELLIGGRYLSLSTEEQLDSITNRVTMVRMPEDLRNWMNGSTIEGGDDI